MAFHNEVTKLKKIICLHFFNNFIAVSTIVSKCVVPANIHTSHTPRRKGGGVPPPHPHRRGPPHPHRRGEYLTPPQKGGVPPPHPHRRGVHWTVSSLHDTISDFVLLHNNFIYFTQFFRRGGYSHIGSVPQPTVRGRTKAFDDLISLPGIFYIVDS